MSRTDAHVPFWIRVARGDFSRTEAHDHADGVCDLPDPFDRDALWRGRGGCYWQWHYEGHDVCSCEMCHGGDRMRDERRADRQRERRRLRATVDRWNNGHRDDVDA